jgi:hypothetical protein
MAITRKRQNEPVNIEKATSDFISGAPDASQTLQRKTIKTLGRKSIITLSISPDVLASLDAWAKARGMSRAAAVSFAVSNL